MVKSDFVIHLLFFSNNSEPWVCRNRLEGCRSPGFDRFTRKNAIGISVVQSFTIIGNIVNNINSNTLVERRYCPTQKLHPNGPAMIHFHSVGEVHIHNHYN